MRNVLAHAGRQGRRVVSAFIATAFAQEDAAAARIQWRRVADQLRAKLPKLAAFLDEAEADVLAYMSFPAQHRAKLHSTNPIERLNRDQATHRRRRDLSQRGRHRPLPNLLPTHRSFHVRRSMIASAASALSHSIVSGSLSLSTVFGEQAQLRVIFDDQCIWR
jgi:hypothetical protein